MINPFIALMVFVGYAEDRLQELKQEKGATAVEYGLMVGLIAAVIIATVVTLGGQLDTLFKKITTALTGAGGGGATTTTP
jgi:pilus assembly protein Flp/PilA